MAAVCSARAGPKIAATSFFCSRLVPCPKGSRDPNNRASGEKTVNIIIFGALHFLWTLRVWNAKWVHVCGKEGVDVSYEAKGMAYVKLDAFGI